MSWSKLAPTAKVCSRWHTVLRWASCISLWTAGKLPLAWPLSFAFTPLHAHILSDSTDCSYSSFSWQLLTISPERVSAVFKVLGKWFNIPIRREFLQIPRTNECCNKAKPPARQRGWGGAGLQAFVWPPLLCDDTAPHWELRGAGLTSLVTCPWPKLAEVK